MAVQYGGLPDEVLHDEWKRIRRRREAASLPADPPNDDGAEREPPGLVGLSLSGGGIRSALVNLGLIQAFEKAGLLRRVDYLSTVSGGSYIGGFLTALICRVGGADEGEGRTEGAPRKSEAAIDRLRLSAGKDGRQPREVTALLRRARYLRQPGRFVARYLLGLTANLMLAAGLLGLFGAGAAWLFRSLDFEPAAATLHEVGRWASKDARLNWLIRSDPKLGSDFVRASLPALACLSIFFALRLAGRSTARVPQPAERHRGAPGQTPGASERKPNTSDRLLAAGTAFGYLAAASAVLGALTLLANGDTNLGPLEYLFPSWSADAAMGGPGSDRVVASRLPAYEALQAVHIFTAVVVVAGVLAMLLFPGRLLQSGHRPGGTWQRKLLDLVLIVLVAGLPMLAFYSFARENVSGAAPTRRSVDWDRHVAPEISRGLPVIHSTVLLPEPSATTWWDPRYNAAVNRLLEEYAGEMAAAVLALNRSDDTGTVGWLQEARVDRLRGVIWTALGDEGRMDPPAAAVAEFLRTTVVGAEPTVGTPAEPTAPQLTGLFLRAFKLPPGDERLPEVAPVMAAVAEAEDHLGLGRTLVKPENPKQDGDRKEKETPEPFQAYGSWLPEEVGTPYQARSAITAAGVPLVVADQNHRKLWFVISLLMVLAAGLLVNFNGTSMHGYYKECLAGAFVEPASGDRRTPLSQLDATPYGGPYLLVNATLNLFGRPGHGPDGVPRASTYTFTFAPGSSGSVPTGFWPTEPRSRGQAALPERYDDLAEVVAISGAAVSPVGVHSRTLALLMTLANFRLGQWMPRPTAGTLKFRLTPLTVLDDVVKDLAGKDRVDRRHWFISDGGHNDNLGLWPLLQRRCRLIIVSDATMDPGHGFPDFVRICRRARDEAGIRFSGLTSPPPSGGDVLKPLDLDPLRPLGRRDRGEAADRLAKVTDRLSKVADAITNLGDGLAKRFCDRHFLVLKAYYPEETQATIVYVKSSLDGDEDADLIAHFREHLSFPHDPTLDQFLEPDEAASYRQLGEHLGRDVTKAVAPLLGDRRRSTSLEDIIDALLTADVGKATAEKSREGDPVDETPRDSGFEAAAPPVGATPAAAGPKPR